MDYPKLASALRRAHDLRTARSAALVDNDRFSGLDELLTHLDDLAGTFTEDDALRRLAFLVARARADVETAVEATLAGYLAVAGNAMRDVMEIADLLRDFAVDPSLVDDWFTADARRLRRTFAPAEIRKRLHEAGEHPYVWSDSSADYKAHSAALHVSPYIDLAIPLGCTDDGGWNGNVGFAEIFEHTYDLLVALLRLTQAVSPGAVACAQASRSLPAFMAAMSRSRWSPTTMLLRTAAHMQRESGV